MSGAARKRHLKSQFNTLPLIAAFVAVAAAFAFFPKVSSGLVAAVFLVLSVFCEYEGKRLAWQGRRARGVVAGHTQEEDFYFPVIEIDDADAGKKRITLESGSGVRRPAVGKRVVVLYYASGRVGCLIDSFWGRHGFPLVLFGFAAVFALGVWVL